eukprot:s1095_g8.t1
MESSGRPFGSQGDGGFTVLRWGWRHPSDTMALPMPMQVQPAPNPRLEEAQQRRTWGAATSDALSARYTAVADDAQQSAKKREAAMIFAVAEGHINDNEDFMLETAQAIQTVLEQEAAGTDADFDAALQAGTQALEMFKDLGDIEGVSDSLRVVVDAMRLAAAKKEAGAARLALRLASEELVWFREQGQKRGQASMLLAMARVNTSGKRGVKDRDQGIRQAKEALKIYRELGDKPMEGAVLLVKSFQEAIGAANKALAIFEDAEDSRSEARSLHLLAEARFGNRQMEGGKQAADDAIAIWTELGLRRQEAIEHLSATKYAVRGHIILKESDEAMALAAEAAAAPDSRRESKSASTSTNGQDPACECVVT